MTFLTAALIAVTAFMTAASIRGFLSQIEWPEWLADLFEDDGTAHGCL